jgi:hypothetical protein
MPLREQTAVSRQGRTAGGHGGYTPGYAIGVATETVRCGDCISVAGRVGWSCGNSDA